jgi:hypothetical protein
MRLLCRLVAPVALVLCLLVAGTASARIVAFKSIAGIELGTSESDVREELGEPSSVREGPVLGTRTFVYKRRKLEVMIGDGGVSSVTTRSRGERMSNGLGAGVSERTLKRKLRGESCGSVPQSRYKLCGISRNGTSMEFWLLRGRVSAVALSAPNPDAAQ